MRTVEKMIGKITNELVRWNVKTPKALDEQVEKAIGQGFYASKSDLIRDAVRKILETLKETTTPEENHSQVKENA
jgi:Arc/MetJ-type ribon-helix-helix transcriptional regulator